jgi:hypothetical protein
MILLLTPTVAEGFVFVPAPRSVALHNNKNHMHQYLHQQCLLLHLQGGGSGSGGSSSSRSHGGESGSTLFSISPTSTIISSGAAAAAAAAAAEIITVPTSPIPGMKPGTSGLRKKVEVWQEPAYLENFVQALIDTAAAYNNNANTIVPETCVLRREGSECEGCNI